MVKLGDCLSLSSGKFLPTKNRVTGDFNVYGGNGITGKHNEYFIYEPTVVIGRVGEYCGSVYLTEENVWVTDNALYVTKFLKIIDRKYICYALNAKNLNSYANKSGQPSISQSAILNIEIALPPLDIQKQIAKTLDTTAELLAMRKQQLAELDNLIKSTFYVMFGDPTTNEKGWEIKTLGSICNLIKDGPHASPNYVQSGIPFISVNNIIKGYWDLDKVKYINREDYEKFSKRCKPEYGDVLYTKGGTTGYAKYVDRDFEFMNWVHIAVLKYKREVINGIFLEKMLNIEYCYNQSQQYTRGIANRDLVLGQMSKIILFVPPLNLQIQFADIVIKIEEQKALVKKAIDETQNLFDSLMSEHFD